MIEYIEKLLNGRSVEWKTLEQTFEIRNGYTPSKSNPDFWEGGSIPWYRMEDLRCNGGLLKDSIQHITLSAIKGKGLFEAGSIIMATTATIGEHALLIADSLANQRFTNFSIRKSLKNNLLPKYVYYYFFIIDDWCKRNVDVSSFPSVKMSELKRQLFPIPPLSVQSEIVRILDKFTLLEAELEAELECRRKQYGFYRDKLLSEEYLLTRGKVEWRTLGEVAEFYNGLTGKNTHDFEIGNARYVPYKNIFDNIEINESQLECVTVGVNEKQNNIQYGDVLFTGSSETPEEVGMSCAVTKHFAEPIYLNSFSFGIRFHKYIQIAPAFAKYIFRCTFVRKQIIKTANGVTRFNVSKVKFKRISIPIPPLEVQEEIVRILDRFDVLTNSISEGLPREIELRRKQYEYYRERLLSFDR